MSPEVRNFKGGVGAHFTVVLPLVAFVLTPNGCANHGVTFVAEGEAMDFHVMCTWIEETTHPTTLLNPFLMSVIIIMILSIHWVEPLKLGGLLHKDKCF